MTNSLIFDITPLMETATGTRELYSFDMPLDFENIKVTSHTTGKVEIMKIEDGFNANVTNLDLKVEVLCKRCLKKISQNIHIDMTERQFFMHKPESVDDENDLYLVNKKDLTIDLGEFLRQEIILHFPSIPVCSKSCKGLCPTCGKDKNKKDCNCSEQKMEEYKPLAILKKLIKNK